MIRKLELATSTYPGFLGGCAKTPTLRRINDAGLAVVMPGLQLCGGQVEHSSSLDRPTASLECLATRVLWLRATDLDRTSNPDIRTHRRSIRRIAIPPEYLGSY